MEHVEAKVRVIERLRERGAKDAVASAHFIEAKIASDPEGMLAAADTFDIDALDGLTDENKAIKGTRGEYDGRREREELEARAAAVGPYVPLSDQVGSDDDVRFVGNLR